MNTNITTLALNLLISERINHRIVFAIKIKELINQNSEDSDNEILTKNNFSSAIDKCTQDPNCESRDIFYELAQYYNQKINGKSTFSAVA
jgi:hypothetical protein